MKARVILTTHPLEIINWVRSKFKGKDWAEGVQEKLRKHLILKARRYIIKVGFSIQKLETQENYKRTKVGILESNLQMESNCDPIRNTQASDKRELKNCRGNKVVKLKILTKCLDEAFFMTRLGGN